jgi:hypothetical protein
MTTTRNSTDTMRRAVCLAMAVLIVGTGLALGSVVADVAFHSASAATHTTPVA